VIILERDDKALEMINTINGCSLTQIARACYSENQKEPGKKNNYADKKARERMQMMFESKMVKRERSHLNAEYIYFKKKSVKKNHSLVISEFYTRLVELGCEIDKFAVERELAGVFPDIQVVVGYKGYTHYFFVEVQMNSNPIEHHIQKYQDLYASREVLKVYPVFPKVILITKQHYTPPPSSIKFYQLNLKCEDIEKIFL